MAADTATLYARSSQLTAIRQQPDFCVLQCVSSEADTQFATCMSTFQLYATVAP
jgi:hypothetical protein